MMLYYYKSKFYFYLSNLQNFNNIFVLCFSHNGLIVLDALALCVGFVHCFISGISLSVELSL